MARLNSIATSRQSVSGLAFLCVIEPTTASRISFETLRDCQREQSANQAMLPLERAGVPDHSKQGSDISEGTPAGRARKDPGWAASACGDAGSQYKLWEFSVK